MDSDISIIPHPFQRVCSLTPSERDSSLLFAAAASQITCFDLRTGKILSKWPPVKDDQVNLKTGSHFDEHEPPHKKQRVEDAGTGQLSRQESEDSVEILAERQKGERRKPKVIDESLPKITHLLPVTDQNHLVVVTAEDKSINVFELDHMGTMTLKSKRAMPKRLCAISLTPDGQTLLTGDKFGDVYSLPLHPSADYVRDTTQNGVDREAFQPSATELTVHTKGNREALLQQKMLKQTKVKKEAPDFEHKLLLGHVSLLTDVAVTEVLSGTSRRQFIISSDRDEHIRVSRGIPQTHVIENYCLGHREFVSCVCVLSWAPHLLIAGSGEPSMKLFEWQSGRLLDQETFEGSVREDLRNALVGVESERSLDRLAVAKLLPISPTMSRASANFVLAALEGLPLLLVYRIVDSTRLVHHQTIKLTGNALDMTVLPDGRSFLVSEDVVHVAGSMKSPQSAESVTFSTFEMYQLFDVEKETCSGKSNDDDQTDAGFRWERTSGGIGLNESVQSDPHRADIRETIPDGAVQSKQTYSSLGEFLYGLEHLRKRKGPGDADEQADPEEGEADMETVV